MNIIIPDRISRYIETCLPHGSPGRKWLKNIYISFTGKETVEKLLKKRDQATSEPTIVYDVSFIPHNAYQARTMLLVAEKLIKAGSSVCIIDITDYLKDEGVRKSMADYPGIPFLPLSKLLTKQIDFKVMVCMNDWEGNVIRPLILEAQRQGKPTVGIIEGINDFRDSDIKWKRRAYTTVDYLFMTGEHDRQFFPEKQDKAFVTGIPRLSELLVEKPVLPVKPVAVINVNFTYGVLENMRRFWLKSAIKGCQLAGIGYVITQHPADRVDLRKYNVSGKTMYDTIRDGSIIISRFGSIIIEALAMGKPVVYHNPHGEKALKFQDPMGAYSLSHDSETLATAIRHELAFGMDVRDRANNFLNHHCAINSETDPSETAAQIISRIVTNH